MFTLLARSRATLLCVVFCFSFVRPSCAAISTIGDVTPDPNTTTSDDDLYVGDTATGIMLIDTGSDVASRHAYVGDDAGVIGSVIVGGDDSTWLNSGRLTVGNSGAGILGITRGGLVSSRTGCLGLEPGSTGTATVDGTGSTWSNSGDLYVGMFGTGTVNITGGGQVVSGDGILGDEPGSIGIVTVDGADSTWTSGSLILGHWLYGGTGVLIITGGGQVSSVGGGLGLGLGSTGMLTVSGIGSTWTSTYSLEVGGLGNGTLTISGGGHVTSGAGYLGFALDSTGTVTVDGDGSTWANSGVLCVGGINDDPFSDDGGVGTLTITGGGQVTSGDVYIGANSGSTGIVTVDGAGSTWTNSGDLWLGQNSVQNPYTTAEGGSGAADGELIPGATGTLHITGGGTVDVGGHVRLGCWGGSGTVNLVDGVLRMHGGALAEGIGDGSATLNFAGGRLEGAGTIHLSGGLLQTGGTLAPGNSAGATTIEGGYTLDGGALEIEIDGLGGAGVDWDLVEVNGTVDLLGENGVADGVLDIVLGFAPSPGQGLLILKNDDIDPIIGTFASGSTVYAPYEGSLYEFAIDYTAGDGNDLGLWTQGLAVALLGDYNCDGAVDAADYTVWRDHMGEFVALSNEHPGQTPGSVTEEDYLVWKANFGNTGGGTGTAGQVSGGTPAAIPEPTTVVLLAIGFAAGGMFLRRAKSPVRSAIRSPFKRDFPLLADRDSRLEYEYGPHSDPTHRNPQEPGRPRPRLHRRYARPRAGHLR